MRNEPRSASLRVAGLLLLLLLFTEQGAAAAADVRSERKSSSAWVRAAGARSLSARPYPAPDCGPAAFPLPVDLVPAGAVVRLPPGAAPRDRAPRSARLPAALPRGPPLPA